MKLQIKLTVKYLYKKTKNKQKNPDNSKWWWRYILIIPSVWKTDSTKADYTTAKNTLARKLIETFFIINQNNNNNKKKPQKTTRNEPSPSTIE